MVFIDFSLMFIDLSMVSRDLSDVASWPLMLCKFKEALQSLKLFSLGPCSLARPQVWPGKLKAKGWEKSANKFCLGWALSNWNLNSGPTAPSLWDKNSLGNIVSRNLWSLNVLCKTIRWLKSVSSSDIASWPLMLCKFKDALQFFQTVFYGAVQSGLSTLVCKAAL